MAVFYLNLNKQVLEGYGVSFKEHHEYIEYKAKRIFVHILLVWGAVVDLAGIIVSTNV